MAAQASSLHAQEITLVDRKYSEQLGLHPGRVSTQGHNMRSEDEYMSEDACCLFSSCSSSSSREAYLSGLRFLALRVIAAAELQPTASAAARLQLLHRPPAPGAPGKIS